MLFSIHGDEWKSFQSQHQTALRSYALSWKPCQGDSSNLPDHRSREARDEFFSQCYRLRSLEQEQEREQERAIARYDDHRLIHDMLVQHAAMQRELREMRGRDATLEQERSCREQ
ncbi:hypothetical protein Tco_0645382 [Tanacetum coccineum]